MALLTIQKYFLYSTALSFFSMKRTIMAAFNQFGVIFCDFARLASQCRYSDAEKKLERAIDKERLKKIRQFGTFVSDTNVGYYKQVCYNLSDAQYLNMQKALIETVINDYPQATTRKSFLLERDVS